MGGMGGGMGAWAAGWGHGRRDGGRLSRPEDVTDRGDAPASDRRRVARAGPARRPRRSGRGRCVGGGNRVQRQGGGGPGPALAELKTGARAETSTTQRAVAGRQFRKVGGAWVDQAFKPAMPTLRLRVLGKAYFRLLARHPELSPIFAMGSRITWVSPGGTALVIDNQGQDEATDSALDRLFTPAR